MDVVVVESPAKARTVTRYVGRGYAVLASYGHVRDLPPRDGSVRPDAGFDMSWAVDAKSEKHLAAIAAALRKADRLYLATDPDREGEAISWHVREVLSQRAALDGVDVKRVVFHEVTRDAVVHALRNPRDLDRRLVDAYLARRALDYLVGFTLSPVLWRKLPGARSAGRVQSVALRLICEREDEIEVFAPREYWSVEADFRTEGGESFTARLTHLDGKKLDRYALGAEGAAREAAATVDAGAYRVAEISRKRIRRQPQPPFTTSTLQQEASRKLGFAAAKTMRVAQRLYEGGDSGGDGGLITYMRTDSVAVSATALRALRALVASRFGADYVPERPHAFRSRAKNAQEAHEAIRPTDAARTPESVAGALNRDEARLYELIWKRAVASAMQSAALEQVAVDVAASDRRTVLRATGSVVLFDGFLRLYREGRDDGEEEDDGAEAILPPLAEGQALDRVATRPEQHFTKPPPRFSEASLVRRLEELGIGRPSTYAAILSVLQERDYVRLDKRRFVPEDRGRIVTAFLSGFFARYVQYDFTADLEDRLDRVAKGEADWRKVMEEFWRDFSAAVRGTDGLRVGDVIDALDRDLGAHFFPAAEGGGKDPRACPSCAGGRLGLKLSRHGAFIGCANYPDCRFTRPLSAGQGAAEAPAEPRDLGADPATGQAVSLRKGPYGFYVQLGEAAKGAKPKRASLLKSMDPAEIQLEQALGLLSLPREVGLHPGSRKPIQAGLGRYGPYLRHDGGYVSLGPDEDLLSIGLNRAVALIDEAPRKGGKGGGPKTLKELGAHPEDGEPVAVLDGRYGPYVRHGRTNASLPEGEAPEEVTLERAVALLAARAAKPRRRAGARKGGSAKRGRTGAAPGEA